MKLLLLAHVLATLGMVAVIWFVQVVHYPLFAEVGAEGFARYADSHQRRISLIVLPLMLTELGTSVALLFAGSTTYAGAWEHWLGLGLIALIWAATLFLSVPEHTRLSGGFDAASIQRLVATNWPRTLGWSARGALVVSWLWRVVQP